MEIEYKGYRIMQSSYNHHVMIVKGDHTVFHHTGAKRSAETKKKISEARMNRNAQ